MLCLKGTAIFCSFQKLRDDVAVPYNAQEATHSIKFLTSILSNRCSHYSERKIRLKDAETVLSFFLELTIQASFDLLEEEKPCAALSAEYFFEQS